jgi:Ca2+-binding EF-hand superfamily protein
MNKTDTVDKKWTDTVGNTVDTAEKFNTAFNIFDKNRDGFITKEEFTIKKVTQFSFWLGRWRNMMSTTIVWALEEFRRVHSCSALVSKKISKEQIAAVFAKFDSTKDGKLTKAEFRRDGKTRDVEIWGLLHSNGGPVATWQHIFQ